MKAMFVIPTLVSEYVPEKLVPLIAKLIERNIAVNYRNVLLNAMTIVRMEAINLDKNEEIELNFFDFLLNEDALSDIIDQEKDTLKKLESLKVRLDETTKNRETVQKSVAKAHSEYISAEKIYNTAANNRKTPRNTLTTLLDDMNKARDVWYDADADLTNVDNDIRSCEAEIKKVTIELDSLKEKHDEAIEAQKKEARDERNLHAVEVKNDVSGEKFGFEKVKHAQDMATKKVDLEIKKQSAKMASEKHEMEKRDSKLKPADMPGSTFGAVASVELPKGIYFYKDIGLEPTFIEIVLGNTQYLIGLKCTPYKLENADSTLIKMMETGKIGLGSSLKRIVKSWWNSFLRVLPGKAGYIAKGRPISGLTNIIGGSILKAPLPGEDPIMDMEYTPTLYDISTPKYLAKKLKKTGEISSWAAAMVITEKDIENADIDMDHFFKIYRNLVKVGWGDVLILNTTKEILHHCNLTLLSCTQIPLSYLQKLFNIEGVLDFAELSKHAKGPFAANSKPMSTFAKEFDNGK